MSTSDITVTPLKVVFAMIRLAETKLLYSKGPEMLDRLGCTPRGTALHIVNLLDTWLNSERFTTIFEVTWHFTPFDPHSFWNDNNENTQGMFIFMAERLSRIFLNTPMGRTVMNKKCSKHRKKVIFENYLDKYTLNMVEYIDKYLKGPMKKDNKNHVYELVGSQH